MQIQLADIPEDITQKFAKCGLLITSNVVTIGFFGPNRITNLHTDKITLIQLSYTVCPIREAATKSRVPHSPRCWRYYVRNGIFAQIHQAERGEKKVALELLGALI